MEVFDPYGDSVGTVRDLVCVAGAGRRAPRVIGFVVEVPGRRKVFMPMTRVTSIDHGQVVTTGLINMSRFSRRPGENLVFSELLDRPVTVTPDEGTEPFAAVVEDLAMQEHRSRDWALAQVFVRKPTTERGLRLGRRPRGETVIVDLHEVSGLFDSMAAQSAEALLAAYEEMRPADLADALHELSPKRRTEVAHAMPDEQLADVLEELPDDDRVEILTNLHRERAADVLEEMEPDDAADLLADLPETTQEQLLSLMEPDEAAPLRRLLTYAEDTAGGLMTPEPVIMGPDATIAEALAHIRRQELSPAVASMVLVVRPPLETPTGRWLGMVHFQALLREPPSTQVGAIVDKNVEPLHVDDSLDEITRRLATYNLVMLPVVDENVRLLGAVTVDDVLDHILPEDWREDRDGGEDDVHDRS